MTTKARRIAAEVLTWLYVIATVVATLDWIRHRIIRRAPRWPIQEFFVTLNIPVTASLVSVIGLGLVTAAIMKRKRFALMVIGVFQLIGLATDVASFIYTIRHRPMPPLPFTDIDRGAMAALNLALSIALLVTVVWLRPAFPARVKRGSWGIAIAILAAGLLLDLGLTQLLLRTATDARGPAWQVLSVTLLNAIGLPVPRGWHVAVGRVIPQVTGGIAGLSLLFAVGAFLRSARFTGGWQQHNEVALRTLLAEYGDEDSLGYYATRRDKMLYFSDNRRAVIAYRVIGSVCLASGDPIGDRRLWPDLIHAWASYARTYGWTPAVLACSEAGARAYATSIGTEVINLGDEAILHPDRFRLDSTGMTPVRHAQRRARRTGITVRIQRAEDLDEVDLASLDQLAGDWRVGGTERGFSMALGRFGDPADGRCLVVTAYDAEDRPIALLSFVPWGRRGLSLDLMRRSPDAPNGTNELIITELMAWADDNGIARISLNFAFFRRVFAEAEDVSAGALTRFNSQLLSWLDRYWQVERLYLSNAKYQPSWQSRYVCLPSIIDLLPVALASARAEGFLPLPPWIRGAEVGGALDAAHLATVRELANRRPIESLHPRRDDQTRQRFAHLAELRATGRSGHPLGRTEVVRLSAADREQPDGRPLVGRVRRVRDHGGVCFVDVVDGRVTAQFVLEAGRLGRDAVREFARLVDTGDLVQLAAEPIRTRNGTASWGVSSWRMLAKSLRPVPWEGFDNPDARLRNRSLDLIVHPEEIEVLRARSRAIDAIRATLRDGGYQEVETPILQTIHGGASARPFRTEINAYGTDLVLRIAPELMLKRLLVGGLGPVFELGRNFRNEGADATHNPEFTVLEAYEPFADYTDMRRLTEQLVRAAAVAVHGREVMPLDMGAGSGAPNPGTSDPGAPFLDRGAKSPSDPGMELVDISGEWPVITVCDALSAAVGRTITIDTDLEDLLSLAHQHGIHVRDGWGPGALIEELYGELVEARTVRPTFYTDFPAETSPLAGPHRSEPGLVERWDLVAGGMELGTAYSELTDPVEQRRRFVEQSWRAAAGDPEAMEVDEDFLTALEVGMPPAGGLGIGIDRLVMALTDRPIREVLTFPFVRPRG
ncbi:bifunctional lysylphosphatidylglycerol synthetase/lysine--tRNA ligase LysX [Raineyella sp. W15-4]|uniref:bifunctional lysylphosphatidylglycerol synthetase/lysine--tRNA ligase LysX n=1 Tax=Raineyella sp. W15-4 TaxID=3081651 RepID=UPI00295393BC|nr:bifunctional lysylphosphatidylglycerol synthetase/lysine--tRNA ligase LysX [Raineyella sp. W15-4]WOQ16386.1 bifunctional lysylphosphatidylglycerol synthetase/lysine--tRNA ligase LysX [Raineyella sp. W15-4]